jgi:hypothetical protein
MVDEVAKIWKDWADRMGGDNIGSIGAILISPFVFSFAPLMRSHSIAGIVELTQFFRDTYPSFLVTGTIGGGLFYNKYTNQTIGGFGVSLGAGYEFARKVAVGCDFLYNTTEDKIQAFSVLISLKKFFY